MLSGKLVHLIESNQQEIAERIMRDIRQHPDLNHLRKVPELELRERGQQILENLGHWLVSGNEEELAREYEVIGRTRLHEGVPLHESIRGLCLIKDRMVDFVEEQGIERDCVALYAEEELDRRVGRFFDLLVIHLARGYEIAWRHSAAHATAHGG
jgi:hypothetical protein